MQVKIKKKTKKLLRFNKSVKNNLKIKKSYI